MKRSLHYVFFASSLLLTSVWYVRADNEMPMAHHVQTSFSHSKSDQMQMQTQALNMVIEDDKLHEERASLQAASPAQLVVWWTCLVSEMVLLAWIIHVHPV